MFVFVMEKQIMSQSWGFTELYWNKFDKIHLKYDYTVRTYIRGVCVEGGGVNTLPGSRG